MASHASRESRAPASPSPGTGLQPRPRSHVFASETTRIDPPAAGQYWRLRQALPEVSSNRASHPAMPAGLVLLVKDVETQVDGTPHAVHLAAHPNWHEGPRRTPWMPDFMYEDFLQLWEPIDNGDAVRAAEIAALQHEMGETQRAMLEPPPAPKVAGAIGHQPTPNAGGDGRELATPAGLRDMALYAASVKDQAEQKVAWITQHTQVLGGQTYRLAQFHQERAEAMLARASAQLKGVDKLLDTVRKLKLYTGEGVEVVQVCDGATAPAAARLTFYQDVLSLDEELLIHLDAGGLDHRDLDELPGILKDKAVADRLIPSPRGFVLCRFRARDKEFFATSASDSASAVLASAIANAQENAIAKELRLLYRDGERFYLVSASEVFPNIKQLLPSTAEQDDYFQRKGGWRDQDAGRITPEDLDFASAQRAQLGALNDYAKVLVVCWGLHDRTDLFATTQIPRFSSWLDPGVQSAYMALVSHDGMLGQDREDYAAYSRRMNAYLGAGSMVAVHVARCTRDSAPGLYLGSEDVRTYTPVASFVTARVKIEKGRPYIEFATRYAGHRKVSRADAQAKCYLDVAETPFLVLDRLHAQDLTYYLTSRKQRRRYMEYVGLFQHAREYVRQRDADEAPVRAALRQAVAEARLAHDADTLEEAITSAIATWRAASPSLVLPGDRLWSEASVPLLNALHAALAPHDDRIARAAALAAEQGRTPLRLTHAGNGAWHLYATSSAAERDARLRQWPWVANLTLSWDRAGAPRVVSVKQGPLRKESSELLVHEWPQASDKAWRAPAPENLSLRQVRLLLDAAEHAATLGDPQASGTDWVALAEEGLAWARRHSKGMVARPVLVVPLGTADVCKVEEVRTSSGLAPAETPLFRSSEHRPAVLCWAVDLWSLCHARAPDSARAAVKAAAVCIYKNKEYAESRIGKEADLAGRLTFFQLRAYRPHAGLGYFISATAGHTLDESEGWHFGNPDGNEARILKAHHARRTGWSQPKVCQVTSLGSFGAASFPHLAKVCDRPARPQAA